MLFLLFLISMLKAGLHLFSYLSSRNSPSLHVVRAVPSELTKAHLFCPVSLPTLLSPRL